MEIVRDAGRCRQRQRSSWEMIKAAQRWVDSAIDCSPRDIRNSRCTTERDRRTSQRWKLSCQRLSNNDSMRRKKKSTIQNLHESRCPHPKWNCCTGWPCTSTAPGTSHWTPLSTSPSGRLSHHGDDLMKTKHRKITEWISNWGTGGEKNGTGDSGDHEFSWCSRRNISIQDNRRISDRKLGMAKSSQAVHRNGFSELSGTSYGKGNTSIHMPT